MTVVASFEIAGMNSLQAALAASPLVAVEALAGAMYQEANDIMSDSKREVPVKLGTLRASGTVEQPRILGTTVEVALGYGGAAQSYAVIQHENKNFHHTVGKYHYLVDPMNAHAAGLADRLAARVALVPLWPGVR